LDSYRDHAHYEIVLILVQHSIKPLPARHSSLNYIVLENLDDVMDTAIGWLLDVTVEWKAAALWITMTEGTFIRLQPSFCILQKNDADAELFHILSQQPKIRVEWQNNMAQFFYVWILRK
jgi:hypothetical protein